ncbi:sugar ABC transporter permease [Phytohabitans sp. ZYX-F-186]|uniref:Sugar ABC transporter permease n=1 Tax=Phytohabitans maris TaxID=3071409 RepID=A0ABU0ZKF9_9ACTN|nr:sugar ABC transporter permease [Phytohabitans sp. ZYX-F-186]
MTAVDVAAPQATRPVPRGPDRQGPRRRRAGRVPFWLAVPSLGGLAVLLAYPTIYLVGLAFTRSSLARPLQQWSGFDNFVEANRSLAFNGSLVRSVVFALAGSLLQVALGTGLAVLLRARGPRLGAAGTLLLLPLVTPPVMVGVAWKLMLAPVGGSFAGVWSALGVPGFNPLGSGPGAFTTLLLIDAWQWTPFVTLLVFAALLGVDGELLEAAQLDGAGAWRSFRSVVWPAILPTVLAVALIKVVIGFKVFDLVVVVTEGGPGVSTILSSYEIYRTGLRGQYDMGTAAAETLVFAVVVGVITAALTAARHRVVRDR